MPIQTSPIDIPFGGGVDEKTRLEKVAPGSFLALQNLRVAKRGSYSKRFGYSAIGRTQIETGSNMPSGHRLASYRDELIQSDGVNLYTRSAALDAWRKVSGYAPQCGVSSLSVAAIPIEELVGVETLIAHDCALVGNYAVIAWNVRPPGYDEAFAQVFACVVDITNGAIVSAPEALFQGRAQRMCVVAVGTKAVILFSKLDDGTSSVYGAVLDTSSRAGFAAGWINTSAPLHPKDFGLPFINGTPDDTTSIRDTGIFDATGQDGSNFAIAFVNNNTLSSDGNSVTLGSYSTDLALQSSTVVAASSIEGTHPGEISVAGSVADGILWISYPKDDGVHVWLRGYNPSTLIEGVTSALLLDMPGVHPPNTLLMGVTDAGEVTVVAQQDVGDVVLVRGAKVVSTTIVPQLNPFQIFNANPTIRPFRVNERAYFGIGDAVDTNSQWVIDWTATSADAGSDLIGPDEYVTGYVRPIACPFPRLCDPGAITSGHGSHPMILSGSTAMVAIPERLTAESSSIQIVSMDFNAPNTGQSSIMLDGAAFSGSLPSYYDGVRSFELGFMTRPKISGDVSAASPGLTGRYGYVAVYEHVDARGQWHVSNISDVIFISPSDQEVVISCSCLQITNRGDSVSAGLAGPSQLRAAVYRTTGDGGVTGTIFHRVSSVANVIATLQIIDDTPDSILLTRPTLYTQPGIPNTAQVKVNPPPFSSITSSIDRIIGASGKTVWYSGQAVEGEAPWFTDLFQFPVEPGGDITALASMDGSLVIFKRNSIYFVDGSGPADNGAGGDFSSPQAISTEVGCIEPRSIVVTSDGIMFQSLRGIELLTRARSVANYFGQPVENELSAKPIITSAVLDEAKGRVFFSLVASEDAVAGSFVVWDMVNQVWTTETTGEQAPKGAIMWGQNIGTVPVRTWLSSSGAIWQESTYSYLDAGTNWAPSVLQTPWIHSGLLGYQIAIRSMLFAQAATGHDLTIEVSYDYSDTPTDSRTWTAAEIASFATSREQLEIGFTKPECTAFQVRVSDAAPSSGSVGTGQGAILIGLQVDGADQGILVPMPEANRR